MGLYGLALGVTGLLTAAAAGYARQSQSSTIPTSAEFRRFQITFLSVYYICMTADWLQGPYVYALYASYGFSRDEIAVLFVCGFGASMVFGTFVGAAADCARLPALDCATSGRWRSPSPPPCALLLPAQS